MAEESWRIPMLVQELATKVQLPPSRYVQPEQYHPISLGVGAEAPERIPVINLGRLLAADDGADEAIKLHLALQNWGLFLVDNHGIETSLMDDLIDASREFFRQPLDEKQKCSNVIDGKHLQVEGYGNDQVKFEDQTLDWNDRLHLKVEPEDERNLALWPKHPESFRALLQEYMMNCKRIKDCILRTMAKTLGIQEDYFVSQFSGKAFLPDSTTILPAQDQILSLASSLILTPGSLPFFSWTKMLVGYKFLKMTSGTMFQPVLTDCWLT